jgi:predicted AAA+ superfamily ATPase
MRRSGLRASVQVNVRTERKEGARRQNARTSSVLIDAGTCGRTKEFPPECRDSDYEKRIKSAYPIHPELFDRLYTDWSTLVKLQRPRGVLRLTAAVIHSLGEKGDRNPLVMPSMVPIDDSRVQFEAHPISLRCLDSHVGEGYRWPRLFAFAHRR